ncbi:MAG TPA: alpha-L-fucosidase, partial [Bacillota bacterium]|nr:alpha-L-fucosidase [Bacillota bacterium]
CITANGTWFWHPGSEQHLRSAEEIASLVRTCNARRANYLLDVPPDRTGRIPEALVKRLQEIGQLLKTK